MKVGDKLTIKTRSMQYSKVLLRDKGYKYYDVTYQIEAVFPHSLVIKELNTANIQLIDKEDWKTIKKSKRNWK